MSKLQAYIYDCEITPNFFSAIFVNVKSNFTAIKKIVKYTKPNEPIRDTINDSLKCDPSIMEKHEFVIFSDGKANRNDYLKLIKFINRDIMLIGFNNNRFDNLLLNKLLDDYYTFKYYGPMEICNVINSLASTIINSGRMWWNNPTLKYLTYLKVPYLSLDLYLMSFEFSKRKSLKQTGIILNWYRIQDMPFKVGHFVLARQVNDFLTYNLNDVLITFLLFIHMYDKVKLRFAITKEYGIENRVSQQKYLSANKSKIGELLATKFYSEKTGLRYEEFKDLRTERSSINLVDCISAKVKFKTDELKTMLDNLLKIVIYNTKHELNVNIDFGGINYALKTGGLHSEDNPAIFEPEVGEIILDCDVTSYYPNIAAKYRVKPDHLVDAFFEIICEVLEDRVKAKANKMKTRADTLKIVLNSWVFGKMGYEHSWSFDEQALIKVTINGQLFLLMLAEAFVLAGIKVISANTDGIVCKFPKSKLDTYYKICKEWEKITGFNLEYTEYVKYVRKDVNNYLTLKPDGSTKTKGIFRDEIDIEDGLATPLVIKKALMVYFIYGTPIKEFIENYRYGNKEEILHFCMSTKIDKKFRFELHHIDGTSESRRKGTLYRYDILQKDVRYYVSNTGGILKKASESKLITECKGQYVTIFNDYVFKDISEHDIYYKWYIDEAQHIINQIEAGREIKRKSTGRSKRYVKPSKTKGKPVPDHPKLF